MQIIFVGNRTPRKTEREGERKRNMGFTIALRGVNINDILFLSITSQQNRQILLHDIFARAVREKEKEEGEEGRRGRERKDLTCPWKNRDSRVEAVFIVFYRTATFSFLLRCWPIHLDTER